jgi:hypothetical protein
MRTITKPLLGALIVALLSTAFTQAAQATQAVQSPSGTSMKVAIVKVRGNSVTVKPADTGEGHFGVWDLKLEAGKNTRIATLDGKNQIKSLKKGMVAEVSFEYAPETSIIMMPIYNRIGNVTTVTMIPIVKTTLRGDILEIREVPGRCTSKNFKLGGKGEKVTVGICRVDGNFEVIANVSDAANGEEVLEALKQGRLKVTNLETGQTQETAFATAGEDYAYASVPGAPRHTVPIRIYIVADGPNDGKPEKSFSVTDRTRL